MKTIELTQGKVAMVDDEDYEYLNQWKWCAVKSKHTYYASRKENKDGKYSRVTMHREIMKITDPQIITDHVDHNGLNNQRNNLRICTTMQNRWNSRYFGKKTSKFVGVSWRETDKKWVATIRYYYKKIHLGLFKNEIEAAIARDKKALELHGDFAVLNFSIKDKKMAG